MDMIFTLVFLGTFALLVAGYALWQSFSTAADRVQMNQDRLNTMPRRDASSFIGGRDRLGE